MNILKPQRLIEDDLTNIVDLLEIIKEDDNIEKAIISNTAIMESNLDKNTFIDVQFKNCNFSNTSFENCGFIRCEFINCKMTGGKFIDSRLYNVIFSETNMNYSNLSMASIENVIFDNSGLRNSNFQENKLKNIVLKKSDLTRSKLF